ncbi:type 1 glutamine amidotransferase domain-containing protein [Algihabitans albus]|uniref:type 1 glutamine amidotransferase domain-containing protein n=1 Tax=Algihabitans albus TaxID=2164067 RepID=UPI000E5C9F89|nr:type 1 glutamine amidotransferase domain-containing protein [Algihabitans albus]
MPKRALIVLTSHAKLGETGKPTGFYWEELAVPYWSLRDAGLAVDIASVEGGAAPADPGSEAEENRPAVVQRFLDDADAMAQRQATLPIAEVDPAAYDVVFLPGGHGTMWDFAQSERLGEVVAQAYEAGAVVGAVCHGPAGLVGAELSNGKPLVAGKRVNGFTDAEEEAVGLTEVVPFLLESKLRALGGLFEGNAETFQAHAVRDGRLVTGQNPRSSERVATLLLQALADIRAAA